MTEQILKTAAARLALLALLLIGGACGYSKRVAQPGKLSLSGRCIAQPDGAASLCGSASSCGFTFSGSRCTVYLQNKAWYPGGYNYINIELDGVYAGRRRVADTVARPFEIVAANDGPHRLVISKATEAANGIVVLTKVMAKNPQPLKDHARVNIEFIGNSITCGFGNDMEIPCGNGSNWYDQHNAYWSYASITARALAARFTISAISGAGIYRNWNSDGPTVPQQYENAFLNTDSTLKWNFSQFTPDIVTIALGTNDMSHGDGKTPRKPFDKNTFIDQYKHFITTVYRHYPRAQLVLLNSPMVGGKDNLLLQECLTTVQTDVNKELNPGRPIRTFWFQPMTPGGCGFHPSKEDDAVMAAQLIPFLKTLL